MKVGRITFSPPPATNINRRMAFAAPLLVSGCAAPTGGGTSEIPIWASEIGTLGATITELTPEMVAAGMPQSAATAMGTIVSNITKAASALNVASTTSQGQSTLGQIEGYINALIPIITPFLSLVPGGSVITIILAGLPAIELALNFASQLSPAAQALVAAKPGAARLSPSQAMVLLAQRQRTFK